jgi:hypothetical protein
MTNPERPSGPFSSPLTEGGRQSWAWLDALGRSFGCAILLVDPEGSVGLLAGASTAAHEVRVLVSTQDPSIMRPILEALREGETQRASLNELALVARRLTVQGEVVGGIAVVRSQRSASSRPLPDFPALDINTIEPWLTSAVEAHLGQQPSDEEEEAFDRISSLHRLLHDGVDSGNQTDVVTAFAEALLAWDGIEVTGYFTDVQGRWIRGMSPPGATGPAIVGAEFGEMLHRTQSKVPSTDLVRFGFPSGRDAVAIQISEATHDPWILLFAEGYRPVNLPRLNLYADLLRDALARLSSIIETRASWAVLQALLGETGDPQRAVDAALRAFAQVLEGISVSLVVINATGTTLLAAGDREPATPVRPFDRGNRLVSTIHLPELGTMQLTVRRARGSNFFRREHHLVDRAAAIFSAWLPGALKQPVQSNGASTQGFEAVLERAASQMTRDGLDVSVVVIVVPERSRRAVLQSWVTDIRGRLRGSDLAGAISDREIGVLLSGTSREYVPVVCARLGESLDAEPGAPTPMGSASRPAGSAADESLVGAARKNLNGRGPKPSTKRAGS